MNIHIDGYVLFSTNNILNWAIFVLITWAVFYHRKASAKRNKMLKKMNKLLKESQEKDKFAGMAAHEIKNPLTIIKMNAELIQRQEHNKRGETIQREVNKVLKLINTIFDYTKLKHGNYQLQEEVFDLKELISGKVDSFKLVYPDRNLLFKTRLRLASLYSDQVAIDQIVTNLVNNAVRYTQKAITIELKKQKKSYVIIIADEGEGIPPDVQKYIWEAFSKKSTIGLGLGLFITKQLITQLKGKISFETGSTGTIFTILLPNTKKKGGRK